MFQKIVGFMMPVVSNIKYRKHSFNTQGGCSGLVTIAPWLLAAGIVVQCSEGQHHLFVPDHLRYPHKILLYGYQGGSE
jgi:hypothetical protein